MKFTAQVYENNLDTLLKYDETKKFRIINLGGLLHDDVQQVINFVYTGGLTLTVDNVIRITRVAKSMKIKVLEDICLNYIMKSIEPVKSDLFTNDDANRTGATRRNLTDKVPGKLFRHEAWKTSVL